MVGKIVGKYDKLHLICKHFPTNLQGRRNVFITAQAKLDHEDYAIKCVGDRQLHDYYLAFEPCEHNNERNVWVADNFASLDMLFLSIIACIISLISPKITLALCLLATCLLQKWNFAFTLRKTGPAKTGATGLIPPALICIL